MKRLLGGLGAARDIWRSAVVRCPANREDSPADAPLGCTWPGASAGGGTLRRHKMGPTTLKPPCTPSSWSSTTRRAASSPKAATQSQRHPLAGERELRSDGWAAGAAVLLDH